MATLRYRDEHNKVGYLLKPTGSDDYHQIIDFLRASHIWLKKTQKRTKSDQNRAKTGSVAKPGEVRSSYSR
nr:hypothetical protein [Tanacetum cinerariifolium]